MTIGSELSAVQRPFIKYAEKSGWTYLSPEKALGLRRGVTSPVLDSVLIAQLQRLNPGIVDHQKAEQLRDRLIRVRPSIEGNLDAWEYLKGLKTVFVEADRRERNVRLLDPVNMENNVFHVTDEFTFSNGTPPDIRPDIVFFVNGVPIIVSETKAAKKMEGIAEAFDDIRYYHKKGPELLALLQVYNLTHLVQFFYGATWNLSRKGLFNWRDEQARDFETLVKTFIAPRRVLRIVTDFILFTRQDEELSKVVLRAHQMRAVERCLQRARDTEKHRGLVWHTQGSGKTYTMITVAKRLVEDPIFDNPTVLMLVDRNELETQLFRNLDEADVAYQEVATKAELRRLLKADHRGLIVSKIHKFDKLDELISERPNVFVLVDEAHRTTGGDLGNYLMGALPQATYLGFTGTPIDRTAHGKGTFKVFGIDDPKGYLDKYSIRESVADGTTVPLHYQLAPNHMLVDRETLDREFLDLKKLEGVSDIEELNKVLEKAVTLKNMMKNDVRVDQVASFVAEHFRSTVEPMGYKAFLVAVDREACTFYKKALDRYLPPDFSEVVISTQGKADPEHLRQHHLTEDKEKAIRKAFRKSEEKPKILIVTEKLLTGFDAPILYCMYLDKPMRDHVLLQAIARVNRPFEDDEGRRKPSGFVLDFVGIFDKLEKALSFDSQDVAGVIDGIDVLKERFDKLIAQGRDDYLSLVAGKYADKAAESVLEHFRDKDRRQEFYAYFKEIEELHEIISPDAFMVPYLKDYGDLADMYRLVKSSYERGIAVDKSFLRKTEQLVRQHTQTSIIKELSGEYEITAESLEAIEGKDQPNTVKVFNLLKAIDRMIEEQANKEPYLLQIGDKALQIAQAFEERQKETLDTLEELRALMQEVAEARQERKATALSPEAFAVYWLLRKSNVDQADQVAKKAGKAFEEFPHWQSSSHQEQEVRKSFYKALIDAKVDGVVEVAQNILRMLRRASS